MSTPSGIKFHKQSQTLELSYSSQTYTLSAEFLRVHSPSAEVKGHGGQGGELPLDKHQVKIIDIQPQGNYAIKLIFSDGHDSGIYRWEYLKELAINQTQLWQNYQKHATSLKESQITSTVKWLDPTPK